MKLKNLSLISTLSVCLFAPAMAQASTYEEAVNEANAAINNAKAANYEWVNSRKLLKKADALHKEGKDDKAMKLVAEARHQGEMAVAQAELQAGVKGPR